MWCKSLVVVLTLSLSTNLFAEHAGSTGTGSATGTGATASSGDRSILDKEDNKKGVALLSENFPNLGKPFVETAFISPMKMKDGDQEREVLPIPKGLEKAVKEKDETDTSAMMAIFFGTIKEGQRDTIVKSVEAEREKELKKSKEDRRDDKHLDLLNRLFWAGKALQGTLVKDPEAQAFLKKFVGEKLDFKSGDFKKIQEQNEGILAKIKDAIDGNKDSKKYLRDTLNRDALLPFVEHQMKGGNKEFASKLVDAVSWKQTDNGPKFIDMVGAGGEPQRLFVGNNATDFQNAVKAFSERPGGAGFSSNALAQEPFETVAKEWYADSSGKLVKGVPPGAKSVISAPQPNKPQTGSTGAVAQNPTTDAKKSATSVKFDPAAAASLVSTKCASCHAGITGAGTSATGFMIKKGGDNFTLAEALQKIDANVGGMKTKVGADVQAQLRDWVAAK